MGFPLKEISEEYKSRREPVCGIGINDAWYLTTTKVNGKPATCPYYRRWVAMLKRGVVCEEWRRFSNFRRWMTRQDWHGKVLDNTLIKPGNAVFEPDACCFAHPQTIRTVRDIDSSKCTVYQYEHQFQSVIDHMGHRKPLGLFDTEEEAHEACRQYANKLIFAAAMAQTDERIRAGLMLRMK